MRLSTVFIKGFRNFKNIKVNLNEKSLIIGPNDIGKSNFIYALRLVLDKSMSELDLELSESDYYAHEPTEKIEILLKFIEATEDCILSKFKGYISDQGELAIKYECSKGDNADGKNFKILVGPADNNLSEVNNRFYLRALNLQYINSNRDLGSFIKREKKYLLATAKDSRTPEEVQADEITLQNIEGTLNSTSEQVTNLNYVSKASSGINTELNALSVTNSNVSVGFDTGATDSKLFVENLKLVTKYNSKPIALGGDGRNNQIYLALWSAQKNSMSEGEPTEISINCIEEPEAHLHPHQQRSLSKYLIGKLNGQVILTSHSPQISCEFAKNSIVNLYKEQHTTKAAREGCSAELEDAIIQFGHRLNIIPAEGFFSSIVFLVEGPSEIVFYKALAEMLGIDLDRYNISIISVDGVGFKTYQKIYSSLGIKTVLRTDRDISKIPNKDIYRIAGLQRLIRSYQNSGNQDDTINQNVLALGNSYLTLPTNQMPGQLNQPVNLLLQNLTKHGLFMSGHDLEWDLIQSPIKTDLEKWYKSTDPNTIYASMTNKKATKMFSFLSDNLDCLKKLKDDPLAWPLHHCVFYSNELHETTNT